MDWENERYVRAYTRDTADLLAVGWQGRAVLWEMLRKADRAGIVEGDAEVLPELLRIPREVVAEGLPRLLGRGCVESGTIDGAECFVIPNFIDAQEARQSDAQRKRDSRGRRRDRARVGKVQPRTGHVYFARRDDGLVKIGFTTRDPQDRVSQIDAGLPETVSLIGAFPGTEADEKTLHGRFAADRVGGEWFSWSEGMAAEVARVAPGQSVPPMAGQMVTPCAQSGQMVTDEALPRVVPGPEVTPSLAVPSLAVPSQAVVARAPAGTRVAPSVPTSSADPGIDPRAHTIAQHIERSCPQVLAVVGDPARYASSLLNDLDAHHKLTVADVCSAMTEAEHDAGPEMAPAQIRKLLRKYMRGVTLRADKRVPGDEPEPDRPRTPPPAEHAAAIARRRQRLIAQHGPPGPNPAALAELQHLEALAEESHP